MGAKRDIDTIHKGYKFRIYPNEDAIAYFRRNFGCCRYVWNHFLAYRIDAYEQKKGLEALQSAEGSGIDLLEAGDGRQGQFEQLDGLRPDKRKQALWSMRQSEGDVVYAAYWMHRRDTGLVDPNLKDTNSFGLSRKLTELKKATVDEGGRKWLYEADATALGYVLRHLDYAYDRFFHNQEFKIVVGDDDNPYGFPQFKFKYSRHKSFTTAGRGVVLDAERNRVKLPKAGWVKCVCHREVEGRIVAATVSEDSCGRFFVSLKCDGVPRPERALTGNDLSVETGVSHAAVLSDGTVYDKGRSYEALERRLAFEKQKLSRMQGSQKGERKSNRFKKQKRKIGKIEAKIAARRNNALHHISKEVVAKGDVVYIRKNDVKRMLKNKDEERDVPRFVEQELHRNLADAGIGELARQVKYKADWSGCEVVEIDNDFPSTQLCSACGYQNAALAGVQGLSIREWDCPECGAHHERDENSAANLLEEGRRLMAGLSK